MGGGKFTQPYLEVSLQTILALLAPQISLPLIMSYLICLGFGVASSTFDLKKVAFFKEEHLMLWPEPSKTAQIPSYILKYQFYKFQEFS